MPSEAMKSRHHKMKGREPSYHVVYKSKHVLGSHGLQRGISTPHTPHLCLPMGEDAG